MSPATGILAGLRIASTLHHLGVDPVDVYLIRHPESPYIPTRIYTRGLIPGISYAEEGRDRWVFRLAGSDNVEIISHPRQEQHA